MPNKYGFINHIEIEHDRVLLFVDNNESYRIIASIADELLLEVGDEICYEPCGVNFGWLVST